MENCKYNSTNQPIIQPNERTTADLQIHVSRFGLTMHIVYFQPLSRTEKNHVKQVTLSNKLKAVERFFHFYWSRWCLSTPIFANTSNSLFYFLHIFNQLVKMLFELSLSPRNFSKIRKLAFDKISSLRITAFNFIDDSLVKASARLSEIDYESPLLWFPLPLFIFNSFYSVSDRWESF